MTGVLIVFEGLDGSGTSTQARMLHEHLMDTGCDSVLTSEPSSGPIGQVIRAAMGGRLLFSSDRTIFDRQMAYLFAADRYDHLHNESDGIDLYLRQGKHVICSRYYFSSLAYHSESEREKELVSFLNSEFPPPGLLIYLDIDVKTSLSRLRRRVRLDAYENLEKLAKVQLNYRKILDDYEGRVLELDATRPCADLHQEICSVVGEVLDAGGF